MRILVYQAFNNGNISTYEGCRVPPNFEGPILFNTDITCLTLLYLDIIHCILHVYLLMRKNWERWIDSSMKTIFLLNPYFFLLTHSFLKRKKNLTHFRILVIWFYQTASSGSRQVQKALLLPWPTKFQLF